jgi:hypothetical protein
MNSIEGTHFVNHCLRGLESMYIPPEGVFSASYRMVSDGTVNVRNRDSGYKFTMNTLMGLHKARATGTKVFLDIQSVYRNVARSVGEQAGSPENIAATVWAGRSIGVEVPGEAVSLFDAILDRPNKYPELSAQGLAWSIAACAACGAEYREKALALLRCAIERYIHSGSALVRHTPSGFRKDWASFAASCYMAYSLLLLARETGNLEARRIGLGIARALVKLQGSQGQWAWFYHVPSGRVVDYYPVYSVHQHAMAPLFLLEAIDQGYAEFREPLVKGFRWILGHNELQTSLVDRDRRIIWRSAVRREPLARMTRFARSVGVTYAGFHSGILNGDSLRINRECRSYELGWALWAFAGRQDFDEILKDPCFA